MRFYTENKIGAENAQKELLRLTELKKLVEIKEVKQTRSSTQNRALHLFFQIAADALNDIGHTYIYTDLEGEIINIRWT